MVEIIHGMIIIKENKSNTVTEILTITNLIITIQIIIEVVTIIREQIQYNNNSNNYRGGDNNNRKQIQYNNNDYNMNIEEIIEEKVDSIKNKDDNDFNVNNLSGDMLNNKDNAFMTTLKVNDIVTCMQVDTGSKHTIIPHGLAKKLGIRDVKKSELQLTAYDGN
ncbi:mitochondrial substrate carrier family protein Y-like [Gordionus sp. m RMFG-2023]|uniref:mitochondrial substrate carrier family protein Y-like n=1 Tax=Gordionus sp. m RMFG-2023 TaxID=3053472 RepID=UPI0031FCFBD8